MSEILQIRRLNKQLDLAFNRAAETFGSLPAQLLGENLGTKPVAEVEESSLYDDALGFDLRRFDLGIGSTPHSFSIDFERSSVHRCHR